MKHEVMLLTLVLTVSLWGQETFHLPRLDTLIVPWEHPNPSNVDGYSIKINNDSSRTIKPGYRTPLIDLPDTLLISVRAFNDVDYSPPLSAIVILHDTTIIPPPPSGDTPYTAYAQGIDKNWKLYGPWSINSAGAGCFWSQQQDVCVTKTIKFPEAGEYKFELFGSTWYGGMFFLQIGRAESIPIEFGTDTTLVVVVENVSAGEMEVTLLSTIRPTELEYIKIMSSIPSAPVSIINLRAEVK